MSRNALLDQPARRRGPIGDPTATALFLTDRSKTADHAALARAKSMERAGSPREDIWDQTGWFNDRGTWSYETDDRDFALLKRPVEVPRELEQRVHEQLKKEKGVLLLEPGEAPSSPRPFAARKKRAKEEHERLLPHLPKFLDHYSHPAAEAAFPKARNALTLRAADSLMDFSGFGAAYDPDLKQILQARVDKKRRPVSDEFLLDGGLHEYQHYLDDEGGYYREETANRAIPYLERPIEKRARNAELRRKWTPEQRKQTPPWLTEGEASTEAWMTRYRKQGDD